MKIVTYTADMGETIKAATEAEFHAMPQAERDAWDEWVWQDQPDKEMALARHEEAFLAWQADNDAGRKIKDVY